MNSKTSNLHHKIGKCTVYSGTAALCQVLISFTCVLRKNVRVREIGERGFDVLLSVGSPGLLE